MSIEEFARKKDEELRLQTLKQEFSRLIPEDYQELAKTAEIAPTAPSYGYSVRDIIKDDALAERLAWENAPINIEDGDLTEMGSMLKKHLSGDILIDLGCGNQNFIPNLAEALGAKRYIGVDIVVAENASQRNGFERAVFKDDMLLFVSKLPDNYGSFFVAGAEDYGGEGIQLPYVSGGEEVEYEADILPSEYMTHLLKEVFRATRAGGLLILGANNTFPNPESVGFKRVELKYPIEADRSTFIYTKE